MKLRTSASAPAIATAMLAGAFGATPAWAQPASSVQAPADASADDAKRIPDIIVTATRREQTLQSAPVPVTAISGADLEQRGASNVKDLTRLIPALKIGELSSGAFQITTRGVGTFGGNNFAEPGVSVNLDGAYLPRTQGSNGIFYDVARIELLKGPQGTLYGRNTTGGVLNIITNNPTNELGGNLTIEGGNYGLFRVSGAVNVPIADGVAFRIAGQRVSRNGYLSDGYSDEKGYAFRAKLKIDPTPNLSIILEANYTEVNGRGNVSVFSPFVASDPYVGLTDARSIALYNAIPAPVGPLLPRPTTNGFVSNVTRGLQGTVEYNFGPARATLIVNNARSTSNYLQYGNGFPVTDDTRNTPLSYTTAELRLASTQDGPLKWVVGGFYFNDKNRTNAIVNQGFTYADTRDLQLLTESYSGFGEATYAIIPSVRITLGGRYTSDTKSLNGRVINPPAPCLPPAAAGTDPVRGAVCISADNGSETFSKFTYKIGVDADIGPHSLVYANYATGFKSGGFFAAPNTAAAGMFPTNGYRPENIEAWTIGSKNRFLDNTLQVNAEAFYWKYKDKQVSHLGFVPPANSVLLVDNAGDATIYGAELDVQWRPTGNDRLAINVQYQHSKYDRFTFKQVIPSWAQPAPPTAPAPIPLTGCAFTPTVGVNGAARGTGFPGTSTINCSGREISLAPEWNATISYSHTFDLGHFGSIVPLVATNISSGYWAGEEYYPGQYQSSFMKTDASVTYNTSDKKFSVTAFINNIEDKAVIQSALIQSTLARSLVYLGAPRTYGVRAGFRF